MEAENDSEWITPQRSVEAWGSHSLLTVNLVVPSMTQEQNTPPSPSPRRVPHRVTSFQLPSHDYGSNRKTLLNAFSVMLTFSILSCNLLSIRKWSILFLWLGSLDNMLDMLGSTSSSEHINRGFVLSSRGNHFVPSSPTPTSLPAWDARHLERSEVSRAGPAGQHETPDSRHNTDAWEEVKWPTCRLSHPLIHPLIHLFIHSLNQWISMNIVLDSEDITVNRTQNSPFLTRVGEEIDTPVNKFRRTEFQIGLGAIRPIRTWKRYGWRGYFRLHDQESSLKVMGKGKEPNHIKNRTNTSQTDLG